MEENATPVDVQMGLQVELKLLSRSRKCERLKFDIVTDPQVDSESGVLGESSLLAKAN